MPASTYTGNKLLDLLLRGVAFTAPSRVFIALHTANPGLTGASDVGIAAWPAFARLDIAQGGAVATGFDAPAAKKTQNAKQLLFPMMDGAATVNVSHWSIWDALTGGNCLWAGALTYVKALNPTDEIVVHIGELDLEID